MSYYISEAIIRDVEREQERPAAMRMTRRESIDANFRLMRARSLAKRHVGGTEDGELVAAALTCPSCGATHWRPDLAARCVSCEVRR